MGKPIQKHGLKGLMARVSVKGMKALDRRSAGYRALVEWRVELMRDLGTEESLTAQEKVLVDLVLRTKLFLDHIDSWLMTQESLVNKKKRSLYPVMAQRNSLTNVMVNLLGQLGLERREKKMPGLMEYIAERKKHDEHHRDDDGPEVVQEDVPAGDVRAR